jgi:hypothetical protein
MCRVGSKVGNQEIRRSSFCWVSASLASISVTACSRDIIRCSLSMLNVSSELRDAVFRSDVEGSTARECTESVESERGLLNQNLNHDGHELTEGQSNKGILS